MHIKFYEDSRNIINSKEYYVFEDDFLDDPSLIRYEGDVGFEGIPLKGFNDLLEFPFDRFKSRKGFEEFLKANGIGENAIVWISNEYAPLSYKCVRHEIIKDATQYFHRSAKIIFGKSEEELLAMEGTAFENLFLKKYTEAANTFPIDD